MKNKTQKILTFLCFTFATSCGSSNGKTEQAPVKSELNAEAPAVITQTSEEVQEEVEVGSKIINLAINRSAKTESFYAEQAKSVLDRSCVSCHASGTFLDLSSLPFKQGDKTQEYILERIVARINDPVAPMPPIRKPDLILSQDEKTTLLTLKETAQELLISVTGLDADKEQTFIKTKTLDSDSDSQTYQINEAELTSTVNLKVVVKRDTLSLIHI